MSSGKTIDIHIEFSPFASYALYRNAVPFIKRVTLSNRSQNDIESARLCISSQPEFLISGHVDAGVIPAETTVETDISWLSLSPLALASLSSPETAKFTLSLLEGDKLIASKTGEAKLLPIDRVLGGNVHPELIASWVRPRSLDAMRTLSAAEKIAAKWGGPSAVSGGYAGADKSGIRRAVAAIYGAVQELGLERSDTKEDALHVKNFSRMLESRSATQLELALFTVSCLEAAGLNALLIWGSGGYMAGAYLEDVCGTEMVGDDISLLLKESDERVSRLAVFSLDSLPRGGSLNYTGAEKAARAALKAGNADYYADIRRCRLGLIRPLPERVKGAEGAVELAGEEDTAFAAQPSEVIARADVDLSAPASREKQWERRLLDFSLRNALLNFKPDKAVRLMLPGAESGVSALLDAKELKLAEAPQGYQAMAAAGQEDFSGTAVRELIALELKAARLRTTCSADELKTRLSAMYRKDKTSTEETGSGTLYAAAGFLRWSGGSAGVSGAYHSAPLALVPVTLVKKSGQGSFFLQVKEDEVQYNTTLLEFLKREFSLDLRGLDKSGAEIGVGEMLAAIARETVPMKGWLVSDEVYLSSFSFARFVMWQDVRQNIEEYKKSKLINAFIAGTSTPYGRGAAAADAVPDDFAPSDIVTPITADESQFAAIAAAVAGKSFVLHGPPGTGKSQTITNIIANALYKGKRVLFVAEKMAALSVVKKRLDAMGIGDFCLEIHSGKAGKQEVAARLMRTLELGAQPVSAPEDFSALESAVKELRGDLNAEIAALHQKGRLGFSVYESAMNYLRYRETGDRMDIDSTFFEGLTERRLYDYEALLGKVAASARECGSVHKTPFSNVGTEVYTDALKENTVAACEVLCAEILHLKNYLELCFAKLPYKPRKLTHSKISALLNLAKILTRNDNGLSALGSKNPELAAALITEYADCQKSYAELESSLLEDYKSLPPEPAAIDELIADFAASEGQPRAGKLTKQLQKALERSQKRRLASLPFWQNAKKYLDARTAAARADAISRELVLKGVKDFQPDSAAQTAAVLRDLETAAKELSPEFAGAALYAAASAVHAGGSPLFSGLLSAFDGFESARQKFHLALVLDADYTAEDEDYIELYRQKARGIADNIDLLPSWCAYRSGCRRLKEKGLSFAASALEDGTLTGENLLESFQKKVFGYLTEAGIADQPLLSRFMGLELEEKISLLGRKCEAFDSSSRELILSKLISALPVRGREGAMGLETVVLSRAVAGDMRGLTLRKLFADIPNLMQAVAPCMLMSPIAVSQYLEPKHGMFDLAVFDEASQMPTSEAVGAIGRAKSVIVVGDPNQLPPTSFFISHSIDEDNLDSEDLESVLDDCLALGMPERHLLWHYRSRHESLIAFSNAMYYGNKLHTFPSPDAMESKVRLMYVDGVYDRGATKQNLAEAQAVVQETLRLLKDPAQRHLSLGIVTFSSAQAAAVEDLLSAALAKNKLEAAAYEREEPLFVKNLENVQGDERDIILFSVGYGPDARGKLTLNFGPLNQLAGWRRLNVAVSRARERMLVFTSLTHSMIDLSKTASKGVAGLKAFLEFAEGGRTKLAIKSSLVEKRARFSVGQFLAEELGALGFECKSDLGVSGFKIDCAIIDPKNKKRFILAVLADGRTASLSRSARDRNILQSQTLRRLGWNVYRLWTVQFVGNPRREARRIKEYIERIQGNSKPNGKSAVARLAKQYKPAQLRQRFESAAFITDEKSQRELRSRLKGIVAAEQPVSWRTLQKRLLQSLNISRVNEKAAALLLELARTEPAVYSEVWQDTEFFFVKGEDAYAASSFRTPGGDESARAIDDIHPGEILAAARAVLEDSITLDMSGLCRSTAQALGYARPGARILDAVQSALRHGVSLGVLVESVQGNVTAS